MTEIEVWLGKDAYNMCKLKVKTIKDINLVRLALDLMERELKAKEKLKCLQS